MPAVEVESLTISYGKVTAVDGLSFTAEAGEVTCLLGPNGAGKTSTVEALEGLRRPSSGRLSVIGLDPRTEHGLLTPRIGVMLQEGGIHPAMRVREALRHAAALYPDPVDVGGLLDRLGLAGLERRTYRQLSGGEQRRLALALALVGRPQVAFLDEPTSGVDPAGRQVIRQVVADLRNDGVTVLLTTHDLDEAERIADRVVIILDGRLVALGTVDELTRSSGSDEQVRFRAPAGLDRASLTAHLDGADVTETAPGEYAVARPPTPRTVAAITAWLAEHDLPLADLRAGRQRLEDVYLRLTAEGASAAPGLGSDSGPAEQPESPAGANGPDDPEAEATDREGGDAAGAGWPWDDDRGDDDDTDDVGDTDVGDRGDTGNVGDLRETDDTGGVPDTGDDTDRGDNDLGDLGVTDDDTDLGDIDRGDTDDTDLGDTDDTGDTDVAAPDRTGHDDPSDIADDEVADRAPRGAESSAGRADDDPGDVADDGVAHRAPRGAGSSAGRADDDQDVVEVDDVRDTTVIPVPADGPRRGNRRRLRRPGRRSTAGDRSDLPVPADPPEPSDTPEPAAPSEPSTFDEFWRSVRRGGDSGGDDTDWTEWRDEGGRRGGKR